MITALLLLQAAQPAPAPTVALPDIELNVSATARRVVIENRGRVDLQLHTAVNGREGTSSTCRRRSFRRAAGSSTMSRSGSVPRPESPTRSRLRRSRSRSRNLPTLSDVLIP